MTKNWPKFQPLSHKPRIFGPCKTEPLQWVHLMCVDCLHLSIYKDKRSHASFLFCCHTKCTRLYTKIEREHPHRQTNVTKPSILNHPKLDCAYSKEEISWPLVYYKAYIHDFYQQITCSAYNQCACLQRKNKWWTENSNYKCVCFLFCWREVMPHVGLYVLSFS